LHRKEIQSLCIFVASRPRAISHTQSPKKKSDSRAFFCYSFYQTLLVPHSPNHTPNHTPLENVDLSLCLREWSISWQCLPSTPGSPPHCSEASPLGSGRRVYRCSRLKAKEIAPLEEEEEEWKPRRGRLCHTRHHPQGSLFLDVLHWIQAARQRLGRRRR